MKFTCFISYPHLDAELMTDFINELAEALRQSITLYLANAEIFVDLKRLKPGYVFDASIASALCQSLCLIAVYVPPYEERAYCLREFEGMERLEGVRKARLKLPELFDKGMIIPIVFRGKDLPSKITKRYQYFDLSRFTPGAQSLLKNRKYAVAIDEIAQYVAALSKAVAGTDVCADCDAYVLPAESDVAPWRQKPMESPFPR